MFLPPKVSNLVHYHSPHACTAVKSTQLLKKARIAILLQAILMFVPSLDNVEHYKLKPKSKVDSGRFIWRETRERSRFLYGALIRNYNAFVSGKIFQLLLLLWVIYTKSIFCVIACMFSFPLIKFNTNLSSDFFKDLCKLQRIFMLHHWTFRQPFQKTFPNILRFKSHIGRVEVIVISLFPFRQRSKIHDFSFLYLQLSWTPKWRQYLHRSFCAINSGLPICVCVQCHNKSRCSTTYE